MASEQLIGRGSDPVWKLGSACLCKVIGSSNACLYTDSVDVGVSWIVDPSLNSHIQREAALRLLVF